MAQAKLKPYEAFRDNIGDAEALLNYAVAFENQRARGMRLELRNRVGEALKIPQKERDQLDCLESDDIFLVFLPTGNLHRDHFLDRRPLLRQSLVAACAALETYVADIAMNFVGRAIRSDIPPRRLRNIPLTVGRWIEIERTYKRRGRAMRNVVEEHLRETSSTAPNRIAEVLLTVGVQDWVKRVDKLRQVKPGTTETQLKGLTDRRNRIAHSADRQGRGRASLEADTVTSYLGIIKSVVEATESLLQAHEV